MLAKIIIISFAGSLMCLDRIFIQTMISRPIVIAPVTGLILGDPYTGLMIGAILELFWMDRVPIGIYIPPNDSIAAAFASSLAILAGGGASGSADRPMIALAVLIAIPFGIAVKQIDVKIMQANNRLSDAAIQEAKELNIHGIERKTYFALARMWLLYLVELFVMQIIFIPLTGKFYPLLPAALHNALAMTYYFLLALGVAVALSTVKLRGVVPVFCALFLIIVLVVEFVHVF
ncbi:MAG TPA: PTS sugar transporter subunit IIC [Smithellaceae bacterium]|nr:PTS sugar transporter subunit IIC [Smithellaceae bacterium]